MAGRRQSGVAVITAVLIVAVAASAASVMLAQQSAMLDQAALIAARAQADEYSRAGLDWARGILSEDARAGEVDALDESWAQPIAGLPVERALVAGRIVDEQAKFNLNNLVAGSARSEADVRTFQRLLASLGLPGELADAVVDWIDADSDLAGNGGAEDPYYLSLPRPYRAGNQPLEQVEELYRVRGFDAHALAKLKPHVTALKAAGRTTINANTASDPVLAAVLGLPPEEVGRDREARRTRPFRTKEQIGQRFPEALGGAIQELDVKSAWFTVQVQVSQDDVSLASEALVGRRPDHSTVVAWRRPLH